MSITDKTELRQMAASATLSALDAIAMVEGKSRADYINQLLDEHAKISLHKASVLVRAMRGNPLLSDGAGGTSA